MCNAMLSQKLMCTLAELSGRAGPRDSPNRHCEGWPSSLSSMGLGGGAGRETSDFFLKLRNFFVPLDEEAEGTMEEDDAPTVEGIELSIDTVDFLVLDFILRGDRCAAQKCAQVRWGKGVERSIPDCRFQDGGSCTSTNPDTMRVRMTAEKSGFVGMPLAEGPRDHTQQPPEIEIHGSSEFFWIMVEDMDSEILLLRHQFILQQ
ncbi:hypothetical protein BS47DRAFT_1367074 [Hydnum rufescens UP504]|uniref:Uncharacterized protein n=1 Tax=Hydnum rufescens UP504 TaxID=1448309 RepID=A0A9P6AJS4_9AGAM|nr:hypothetical protein BS47DRAFT_1367074 [Hydnum rufescens UP504]